MTEKCISREVIKEDGSSNQNSFVRNHPHEEIIKTPLLTIDTLGAPLDCQNRLNCGPLNTTTLKHESHRLSTGFRSRPIGFCWFGSGLSQSGGRPTV